MAKAKDTKENINKDIEPQVEVEENIQTSKPNKSRKFIKRLFLILAIGALILFVLSKQSFDSPPPPTEGVQESSTIETLQQSIFDLFGQGNDSNSGGENIFSRLRIVEEEGAIVSVVEEVSPAVVSIVVERTGFDIFSGPFQSEDGVGTGFIVDSTGLIVTNSHVVDPSSGEYSVLLSDGSTYDVGEIHLDESTDLAIIEIVAKDLPVVELGDSDSIKVGQVAIAIGNALGQFSNSVTVGVVSGVARELIASGGFGDLKTYEGAIQTDAALNPGNSGGPLLNSSGQVIGINVATTRGADNIGFAIPVNTLKPILDGFLKEGRIVRPFIGVSYTIITPEMAQIRDFPEGAFVNRVLPGTPADEAGLQRGDVVLRLNGEDITESNTLGSAIRDLGIGTTVELEVDRNGEVLTLELVLQEAPESLQ